MIPRPTSEAELSELIREAPGAFRITGGGTRPVAEGSGATLGTAGLSGITLYEPGALTLVARAGTPMTEIEAALKAENQHLPFEPLDHRRLMGTDGTPTLGGVVATNASGPRRIQAGACRDSLIGVRFVTGTGEVVKNGGRVMKNVTGYDLVKLLCGSYGTLGVLSEVSFKVLPAPAIQATVLIDGLDEAQAAAAMARALGSPFEVTGAAHLPRGPAGTPLTLLRLEGLSDSVAYRTGRLTELLAPFGAVRAERDPDSSAAAWRDIRDVAAFAGLPGDVWRLSVRPSDGPDIAARTGGEVIYDWGGGLIWALVPEGTDLRARLGEFTGHATLIRASAEVKSRLGVFHPEPPSIARLSAGLRAKFDPRGILNPGVMG